MRLIRKKNVSDSIIRYWQNIELCNGISERLDYIAVERGNLYARLFHNKYLKRDPGPMAPVFAIKEGALLINNDPALLAEYSNRTYARRGTLHNYLSWMKRTNERAVRLMELIRKEYGVE